MHWRALATTGIWTIHTTKAMNLPLFLTLFNLIVLRVIANAFNQATTVADVSGSALQQSHDEVSEEGEK